MRWQPLYYVFVNCHAIDANHYIQLNRIESLLLELHSSVLELFCDRGRSANALCATPFFFFVDALPAYTPFVRGRSLARLLVLHVSCASLARFLRRFARLLHAPFRKREHGTRSGMCGRMCFGRALYQLANIGGWCVRIASYPAQKNAFVAGVAPTGTGEGSRGKEKRGRSGHNGDSSRSSACSRLSAALGCMLSAACSRLSARVLSCSRAAYSHAACSLAACSRAARRRTVRL